MSDYRITTDKVAETLLKVLEQNDNTDNYFDDSYLIRDILASLGRLDNINYLARVSSEIYRQFKLDQISNSSPQFAITTGAIKGYFNLRKQIYRFIHSKKQHISEGDPLKDNRIKLGADQGPLGQINQMSDQRNASQLALGGPKQLTPEDLKKDQISEAEEILDQMKDDIDGLLMDPLTPLQLRLFIYDHEIKDIIFHRSLPLIVSVTQVLKELINFIISLARPTSDPRRSLQFAS